MPGFYFVEADGCPAPFDFRLHTNARRRVAFAYGSDGRITHDVSTHLPDQAGTRHVCNPTITTHPHAQEADGGATGGGREIVPRRVFAHVSRPDQAGVIGGGTKNRRYLGILFRVYLSTTAPARFLGAGAAETNGFGFNANIGAPISRRASLTISGTAS